MRTVKHCRGGLCVVVAAGLALGGATLAPAQDVAIVSAASGTATTAQTYNQDIQSKLMGTGLFSSVDIINVNATHGQAPPSLSDLLQYDAVITFSNGTYSDAAGLGDVLADYVDEGGGVVVAVFATSTTTTGRRLEGRWRTDDYEIIRTGGGNQTGAASLGTVHDPNHPIMDGVSTFFGGSSSFRPATFQLSPHGQVIAEWTDGRTLAGVSTQFPGRADLGMFPPSSDVSANFWDSTTDGARLMANTLLYTMNGVDPCPPDWNGDGVVDSDDLFDFLADWAAGDADYNGDGVTDSDDLFDFLADWADPGQFPGC